MIPADYKWLTQALVAQVLVQTLRSLDLRWPEVSAKEHAANLEARKELDAEPVAHEAVAIGAPQADTCWHPARKPVGIIVRSSPTDRCCSRDER